MSGDRLHVLGMGVTAAADAQAALALAYAVIEEAGIDITDLRAIATLDRRADHPALVAVAERLGVPLRGVSAPALAAESERLAKPSRVVEGLTGVSGVCEAAALALAGSDGRLLVEKRVGTGVTAALAVIGEGR